MSIQKFLKSNRSAQEFIESQEALIFNSYTDALDWIKQKSIEYGSKNEFLTSKEYQTVYPYLNNLYKIEKENYKKSAEDAMNEVGIVYGDHVEYTFISSFLTAEPYTGVVINHNGIPYVKYDKGLIDIKNRKSSAWHKGWKKI